MTIAELISHGHIRQLIADAQLDMGLAVTEDDLIHMAFIHLGPSSGLAKVRRALAGLEDA